MKIIYPKNQISDIEDLVSRLTTTAHFLKPFDNEIIEFLDSISKALFKKAKTEPALAPLAFFLRKSNTYSLQDSLSKQLPTNVYTMPQGIVFHIPPTNVDTLFLYTLALSLMAGNSNIVRISNNAGETTRDILDLISNELDRFPNVSQLITFISFDRDINLLRLLSSLCNVRMTWGGDQTIHSVREAEIAVHGKDLAFPDRISLSCISVDAWNDSSLNEKVNVIEGLYNDSFWFDQMACSSPQQIILIGDNKEMFSKVRDEILLMLDKYTQERYITVEGQSINKMVAIVEAFAMGATGTTWAENSTVFIDDLDLANTEMIRPGGGFFSVVFMESISELVPQLSRKLQTLTYFGIDKETLFDFVNFANGRGIDRIVPIGQALNFDNVWDGKNLLFEMHRLVYVN
jgi:hypothetical protein